MSSTFFLGPDLLPTTGEAQHSFGGGVGSGNASQRHRQGGLTWGMAREQLRQVYSMTAYSCPSSSISF